MTSATQLADMPEHSSAHTRGLCSSFLHPTIQTVALNAKLERRSTSFTSAGSCAVHSSNAQLPGRAVTAW